MLENIDIDAVRKLEAERRLKLLGDLVNCSEYEPTKFNDRAHRVYVIRKALVDWWQGYKKNGMDGLTPQWPELSQDVFATIKERYEKLGDLADAETVSDEQIIDLGKKNGWTTRTAQRWLARYRAGGLWALAPGNNPVESSKARKNSPPPELATLSEAQLETVWERREMLGDLANRDTITNEEAQTRADELGISVRTLWSYLTDYRKYGLAGLAPKKRSDKGKSHVISERMERIIQGIRLSNPDWPVRAVRDEACKRAQPLNEMEPSEFQVRNICNNIPEAVRLLADRREDEFRNKYRITYRIRFENVVYQIDHTPVDMLVKDMRSPRYRTTSGEVRPLLTTCMDSQSRLVMAAKFGYDQPDRFVVAAAIRDSLLVSDNKPYGGLPDEIWIDNGKDLVSAHVRQLTRELGIMLQPCLPHQPQHKGIVERFFETLNTRLWSRLPGYVASNVVERNPKARAELTLSELVAEFWPFIEQYHNEVHSQTDNTPLQYWTDNCFAEPVDPRVLDMLLKEPKNRRVIKEGIKYDNRVYWHSVLASLVGQDVLVRAEPWYTAPDEIEVFHRGSWICTAFATDSESGLSITRQQIASAQQEQRESIKQSIQQARDNLAATDRQIEEAENTNDKDSAGTGLSPKPSGKKVSKPENRSRPPEPRKSKKQKPDFLDHLAGLD